MPSQSWEVSPWGKDQHFQTLTEAVNANETRLAQVHGALPSPKTKTLAPSIDSQELACVVKSLKRAKVTFPVTQLSMDIGETSEREQYVIEVLGERIPTQEEKQALSKLILSSFNRHNLPMGDETILDFIDSKDGGQITKIDRERFTNGDCFHLALELHHRTGYPLATFEDQHHCFVMTPSGQVLDVEGAPLTRRDQKRMVNFQERCNVHHSRTGSSNLGNG